MEAAPEAPRPIAYRSPRGRAAWALVAVACATAIAIVNGAVLGLALRESGGPGAVNIVAVAAALILLAPLLEVTAVPAAMAAWAVRCRRNLGLLPEADPRRSQAWAAAGWFVPVANLVVPLLSLRETWSVTAGRRSPLLLVPWWVLWLARAIPVAWVVLATFGRWPIAANASIIAASVAASVLSGVGAMIVVLRLTLLQERRLRPLREGPAPIPPWGRGPKPVRAIATVAVAVIALATLGGVVMLVANTISLALGSVEMVVGPRELLVAWGAGLATCVLFGPVVGTIATALWARRVYRNLPTLGAPSLGWSPGWATASWFIPTANLALPYLVVRDTWPGRDRALLRSWWVTLLAAFALGAVSDVLHTTTPDLTQLAGDITGLAGDLVLLQAGALAVIVILTITRHQQRLLASHAQPATTAATP